MERLAVNIKRLEEKYKRSARKYNQYNLFITIPSIIITSISSIFSFLSSSEYLSENEKNYCIITVAMLTTISAMLQTISTSCEFSVKKIKFTEAAQEFNHISDRIFFERKFPNENEEIFVSKIEKDVEKIKNLCKFIPFDLKEKKFNYNISNDQDCYLDTPPNILDEMPRKRSLYTTQELLNAPDVSTI